MQYVERTIQMLVTFTVYNTRCIYRISFLYLVDSSLCAVGGMLRLIEHDVKTRLVNDISLLLVISFVAALAQVKPSDEQAEGGAISGYSSTNNLNNGATSYSNQAMENNDNNDSFQQQRQVM
jgi:hypothetical protein